MSQNQIVILEEGASELLIDLCELDLSIENLGRLGQRIFVNLDRLKTFNLGSQISNHLMISAIQRRSEQQSAFWI